MSPRILGAIAAIVVLGGGSVAFVWWRDQAARDARVAEVVRSVDAELAAESPEADALRLLLRSVRSTRDDGPSTELDLAEARLLLELGRTQEAWDLARRYSTALDAGDDALLVGARILQAMHAVGGDLDQGRRALGLASVHADRTGSTISELIAWQMAFRIGDAAAWAERGRRLAESDDRERAAIVPAIASELAGLLADRIGLDRESIRDGAGGDAGALAVGRALGDGAVRSAVDLDELSLALREPVPELGLVAALHVLDRFTLLEGDEARSPNAESLARDALGRCGRVLDVLPSSVTARHLTVVALLGIRQSFGMDDEQTARYRSYLQWLVRNASDRDARYTVWTRLAAEFPR